MLHNDNARLRYENRILLEIAKEREEVIKLIMQY